MQAIGKMRVILWTIAANVTSIANGKFLLWQNGSDFAYRFFPLNIHIGEVVINGAS